MQPLFSSLASQAQSISSCSLSSFWVPVSRKKAASMEPTVPKAWQRKLRLRNQLIEMIDRDVGFKLDQTMICLLGNSLPCEGKLPRIFADSFNHVNFEMRRLLSRPLISRATSGSLQDQTSFLTSQHLMSRGYMMNARKTDKGQEITQQDPHIAWSFTGLSIPDPLQSTFLGSSSSLRTLLYTWCSWPSAQSCGRCFPMFGSIEARNSSCDQSAN